MSSTLAAGVGRRLINPPLGIKTLGYSSREGVVQAIESDLTATSLVLANETNKVAVIACDLGAIPLKAATELRRRVSGAIGTSPSHVMINLSHTHCAPSFPGWLTDTDEQIALQQRYQEDMFCRVVESAVEADQTLQQARIGHGWGECHIGVYRREEGPDGEVFLGEVPGAPIDPAVGVIRIDDMDGNPIGTLFSYGCHPVSVGPRSLVASSDFPGAARQIVECVLGGLAIFLQACGADIMPICGIGYEIDCRDTKNRMGAILGGEVLKVASSLRTHVRRGPRTTLGSATSTNLWPWVPIIDDTETVLGAVEEIIPLNFIDLPSLDEAEKILDKHRQALAETQARGARDWEINVATRFADWSEKLVEAVRKNQRTVDIIIQAIRVKDVVLTGLSVEPLFKTGLAIKAQSPFEHTEVLGYTNGSLSYLPREEDYPPNGWDVHERYAIPDLSFHNYNVPVAFDPSSEQRVVDHVRSLIQELV